MQANQSGACYVVDMAVLDTQKLTPSEIDFLLSQALDVHESDIALVEIMKMNLIESAVLSRKLSSKNVTFADVTQTANAISASHKAIQEAYKSMINHSTVVAQQA